MKHSNDNPSRMLDTVNERRSASRARVLTVFATKEFSDSAFAPVRGQLTMSVFDGAPDRFAVPTGRKMSRS